MSASAAPELHTIDEEVISFNKFNEILQIQPGIKTDAQENS
jgi:hypothetical protein